MFNDHEIEVLFAISDCEKEYRRFFSYLGRDIPPVIKQHTNTFILVASLQDEYDAKMLYERTYPENVTEEHRFGYDPLCENKILFSRREAEFFQSFDVQLLYAKCLHFRAQYFKDTILYFIDLIKTLAKQLE